MGATLYDTLLESQAQAQQAAAPPAPPPLRPFAQSQPQPGAARPAVPASAPGRTAAAPSLIDRARALLGGASSLPAQAEAAGQSFLRSYGNVQAATNAALLRAPGQLIGGAMDSAGDLGKFIGDNLDANQVRQHPLKSAAAAALASNPITGSMAASGALLNAIRGPHPGASLADTLSARQSLGQVGNTGVNQMATEGIGILGALVIPGGEGEAAEAASPTAMRILQGAGRLLTNSAKVGAATAVVADPRAGRVSDLIQQAGVHDAVIDFLASHPGDSAAEARLKTGIEGAIANTVLEPLAGAVGGAAKAIRAALAGDGKAAQAGLQEAARAVSPRTGEQSSGGVARPNVIAEASPEEAAQDNVDRAMAGGRTQEARWQAQEQAEKANGTTADRGAESEPSPALGQEATPGTRHTDAADGAAAKPTDQPPATPGSRDALAADANGALDKTQAVERVDPENMNVRPDGKIVVADATKAAADDAGVGRAFAASSEAHPGDQVIFKESDPQGGQRVVGMMGKDDLQHLADDAADYRDHALDAGHAEDLNVRGGPSGNWTIGQLGASYDVPAMMRGIIDRVPGAARPKSDVELMKAAQTAAAAIGERPEDLLQAAANFAGHAGDLDTAMAVHRLVWTQMSRGLDDLVGSDFSQMAPEAIQDAAGRVHNMMTFTTYLEEAKTGIARALRVNALPDADSYLEAFQRAQDAGPSAVKPLRSPGQLPPLPRTPEELQQWVDLWNATKDDPRARQLFLKGLTFTPNKWTSLRNSLANWFSAAIVSGPTSFMRDLIGPATVGALRTIERTAGGFAASLNPALDDTTRAELRAVASQAPVAYAQTAGDCLDALKAGIKAIQQGHGDLGGKNPLDINTSSIPQPLIDAAMAQRRGVTRQAPYLVANAVNMFPQAVHALHGGVNETALTFAYNGEIRAQAMLQASQLGLKGGDFAQFVEDRLMQSTDPITGRAGDGDAFASAQRTTFTKGPTANDPGAYQKLDGLISWLKQNVPEFRYILPIWRVPANAIGETIRRIPGVNFMLSETRRELAGEAGPIAQAEAYGRFMSGAALMGAGMVMARSGMMTGQGPSDAHSRDIWQADGHIPYAIKIGDNWVSYNRLDVVGAMLGIVGSTYDHTVYHGPDQNSMFAGVGALAQYFKDQSALQGLSNLLGFGGNPGEDVRYLDRLARTTVSGFVPNFITELTRDNLDPLARVVHSGPGFSGFASGVWQAVLNKLPIASETLDPQRNLLGEDVYRVGTAGFNTLPLSVSSAKTYASDPVIDELDRLYTKTGWAPGVLSPSAGPNSKLDLRDVKLEDGHSLYDALIRYRGMSQVDGQGLRQSLTDLFNSDTYNHADDGRGDILTDDAGNENRGAMIQRVMSDYNKQAHQDVANASPVAARYLATAKAMNRNTTTTANYTAHDLAGNEPLMRSLGINIQDYEDTVRGQ